MRHTTLSLTVLLWAVIATAQPMPGGPFLPTSFMPKMQVTTGIYPHSVVAADLNGDGKPDLFVARGSSSSNCVLPNTSSSGILSFGTPVVLANDGIDEEGAAAGDLDGDGRIDIVVANGIGGPSVSIYENTGTSGSFAFTKIDLPAVNGPYDVAIGDLDGDGKPDLVIPNNGANTVCFYRNTSTPGNFSFAPRIDIIVGTNPFSVAIGDLDGDGKPDLAVGCQGGAGGLYLVMNTSTAGALSFGMPVHYSTDAAFNTFVHDLDGDGKADVGISTGSGIVVYRNLSTPGSFLFASATAVSSSYTYRSVVSDLDGDGKPDIAAAVSALGGVQAMHNTSTPGTISFESPVTYTVGMDPRYLAAGDLNGDGLIDLISANTADTAISILRNQIGESVAPEVTGFRPTTGVSGTIVHISGINFTGATAVAFGGVPASAFTIDSATGITATVAGGASGDVSVTTPNGTVSLSGFSYIAPIVSYFSPTVGVSGTVVKIRGFNFTGATAVSFGGAPAASFTVDSAQGITATVGAGGTGRVSVTTANGTGSLPGFVYGAPAITSVSPLSAALGTTVTINGVSFSAVAAEDIVYFGGVRASVISATSSQLSVTVPAGATYQPISVTVRGLTAYSSQYFLPLFNTTDPVLSAGSFGLAGTPATGTYPREVATADLDGDGKVDIVVANALSNSLSVLANRSTPGSIVMAGKVDLSTGPDPQRLAIADMDGDGKPEILVLDFNSGKASDISIFPNTSTSGSLSFGSRVSIPCGSGSTDISVRDMNGDGRPDIVIASGNSYVVYVFLNTTASSGNFTFTQTAVINNISYRPSNLVIADLNMDGLPDLAVSGFTFTGVADNPNVYVYTNRSSGGSLNMGLLSPYPVGDFPTYISVGDLDGDGLVDLAVANYSSGTVSFYRNTSSGGAGGGGGGGGAAVSLSASQGLNQLVTTMNFADLNGDGKIDLYTGKTQKGTITLYQNTGTGPGVVSFGDSIVIPVGNFDTFTAIADLDGDGKPDLIAANPIQNNIAILRNRLGEPLVTSLSADSAFKGDTITLLGQDLGGVTAVSFGAVAADSLWVVNSSTVKARVGAGASGPVTVVFGNSAEAIGTFKFLPQVSANGPLTFCGGGSVLLTSTAGIGNQWYKNGSALVGDTLPTLLASDAGIYMVQVKSQGIVTSSAGVTVSPVNVNPPAITRDEAGDLVSSDSIGNQWLLNGVVISGATDRVYHPDHPGSYTVVSTVEDCSSAPSMPYTLALKGQIDMGNGRYISLVPNPVRNSFSVYWTAAGSRLDAVIADSYGRVLKTLVDMPNGTVVDLTGLPKGVYYVKIIGLDGVNIGKTVKILKIE